MKINNSNSKGESQFHETLYRLTRNKLAVIGFAYIIFMLLVALFAPVIAPYDYVEQDYEHIFEAPSSQHLLGTDNLGRDVLSRLIWGSRQSLQIAFLTVFIAAAIGIVVGSIAGYYGGLPDSLLMRFLDIYQSIPVMILSIALATALGPGVLNTIIAVSITISPLFARMMRASIMRVSKMEYIEAAVAINAKNPRIIWDHALPNAFSPMIVLCTMSFGQSMLVAATLSFIGLGAQPPSPEWGAMLTSARGFIRDYPYLITSPGVCIFLGVLSFNMMGDGLRDALDPHLKN